jgi:hypothetical protein
MPYRKPLLCAVVAGGVCIQMSAVQAAGPGSAQETPVPTIDAPFRPAAGAEFAEFAVPLEFDADGYRAIEPHSALRLRGFRLAAGASVDLDLQRFDILTPDARLVVADGDREVDVERPDMLLLRGAVVGAPGSSVFLSLSPHGGNGYILLHGQTWIMSTPPRAGLHALPGTTAVYNLSTLPEGAIQWFDFVCSADELEQNARQLMHGAAVRAMSRSLAARPHGAGERPGDSSGGLPCRRVRIAIDSDWEYTRDVFGGDTQASQAYALTLMAAVGEIFRRDVNTRLEVPFVRVWASSAPPYPASPVDGRLSQLSSHWLSSMGHVQRNAVHLLSGLRRGTGGIAFMSSLCGNGYAVSGYINGFFPTPLQVSHMQNWDVSVVAHELGHNFGAPHTHSVTPPIDNCALGECHNAHLGTIMSYCHTCLPGRWSNQNLDLHHRIIAEEILPFLQSTSCAASLLCAAAGACCLPGGCCQILAPDECTQAGGMYLGNGASCQGCPQQPGACCLASGNCAQLAPAECCAQDGVFRGPGSMCSAITCEPWGACCFVGGMCFIRTPEQCAAQSGVYRGHGSRCAAGVCPGACCFNDGSCAISTSVDCPPLGGIFLGGGTTCSAGSCCDYWRGLGGGLGHTSGSTVNALHVYGGDLVAAGLFGSANGQPAANIARWDGSEWHPWPSGTDGAIRGLAVHQGDLIAGGAFAHAGGVPASRIARWTGLGWEPLGAGMNDEVLALTVHDGGLIAGGLFTSAGGAPAAGIARWDGSVWSSIGPGFDGEVSVLVVFEGDLIAGGLFSGAIARWNGSAWQTFGAGLIPGGLTVPARPAVFAGSLVSSGLAFAGSQFRPAVARWGGQQWSTLGTISGGSSWAGINTLGEYKGQLIVAGDFLFAGDVIAHSIARWDGTAMQRMDFGIGYGGQGNAAHALAVYGGDLIVGGRFTRAGTHSALRIAAWRGCDQACYANCDGSIIEPILNVEDFVCFINRFAEGSVLPHAEQVIHYANCDQSTTAPVLNVEDFVCFLNRFAAGCP